MAKQVFFTKKQKHQMRERRKRKKKQSSQNSGDDHIVVDGQRGNENENDPQEDGHESYNDSSAAGSSRKRPFDDDVGDQSVSEEAKKDAGDAPTSSSSSSSPSSKQTTRLTTKVMDGKLFVLLPSDLSSKDSKKFRKDARRKLRNDVTNPPKSKKRSSTSYTYGGEIVTNEMIDQVEFVTVDEMPSMARLAQKQKQSVSSSKRMKIDNGVDTNNHHPKGGQSNSAAFPSIKQLLKEKQINDEIQKQQSKLQEKLDAVPDTTKQRYLAMDCEMVGIGTDGSRSALARVSIVRWDMSTVVDTFVQVPIRVTDFRTHVSGVEPKHIQKRTGAISPDKCRKIVADLLKDKILVGHALSNDLKALLLTHPKQNIRDTAKYRPFQRYANGKWRPRKLRDLVRENLHGMDGFQEGEHDSTEDAKATMRLFQCVYTKWEKDLANNNNSNKR